MTRDIDLAAIPTLAEAPRRHRKARPGAIALIFEGRETSFAVFDQRSNQVAQALMAAGLTKGDRVAYLGKNSDHYFELLFGAAKCGVVMTPIGWRLAPPEVEHIVRDCEAKLMFVGPEAADCARQVALTQIIAMEPAGSDWPAYEAWRDAQPDSDPRIAIDERDIAVQLYTSGTTGRPKGAMLSHRNILGGRRKAAEANLSWDRWGPDDVSLVAMPVGHIGGTLWGVIGLLNGARGVVIREFDALEVLDVLERDRISKMFIVPAALQILVRQPHVRDIDYTQLKYILYGASPIPLDLLRECMAVFGCGFCQQYGMTETGGAIVYLPPEDHDPAGNPRMRAAGLALPGVELKVVDEAGNSLPPNTVGEVATRSVSNMVGYWRLPEATAAALDEAGWLLTGDAGYLDEDGYLFIHDRVKDMIISGAENIYPAEVESAVYGHPDVAEVAVIGVPDDTWGEAVKAVVALKPGANADPNGIIAFAKTRIAAFKAPKSVDIVDALPRSASGKVLKRQLREPYWIGRTRRVN